MTNRLAEGGATVVATRRECLDPAFDSWRDGRPPAPDDDMSLMRLTRDLPPSPLEHQARSRPMLRTESTPAVRRHREDLELLDAY